MGHRAAGGRRKPLRKLLYNTEPRTEYCIMRYPTGASGSKYRKNKFSTWKLFCFFLRFHFFTSPSRFATSSCFDHESQAGPLNVRRRMRLGHHCRAPPLAVQPSPAPTIRHGGEARRVGAGARRWADLQASVTSTGPVCGQTNPGGRGEIVVGATQSADRSFFDESTSSVW